MRALVRAGLAVLWIVLPLLGCTRFNSPFLTQDRLIVAANSDNVVQIYQVSRTDGDLTLERSLSITAPSRVAAHPTSGAFLVHRNSTHLDCYRYNFRAGDTAPTLVSSTSTGALNTIKIPPDGGAVFYGKTGDATLYSRTLSNCSLGTEQSTARSGRYEFEFLDFSDDGRVGILYENFPGNSGWQLSRELSSDAVTWVRSIAVPSAVNQLGSYVTPNGAYGIIPENGTFLIWNLSTGASNLVTTTGSANSRWALSNTQVLHVRSGVTLEPVTINSNGTGTVGTAVDFGLDNGNGGGALNPGRTYLYIGDQGRLSIWKHPLQAAVPFTGTPTELSLGAVTPSALAYLPGAVRQ